MIYLYLFYDVTDTAPKRSTQTQDPAQIKVNSYLDFGTIYVCLDFLLTQVTSSINTDISLQQFRQMTTSLGKTVYLVSLSDLGC